MDLPACVRSLALCFCSYRDSKAYFLGNFLYFSQAEFYGVLAGCVFEMVQKWTWIEEINTLYYQPKVHTALLTDIDPRAARLQDLVYDFKVPNDVFGSVYEETSRNHIPLPCNIQAGIKDM
jgi:hypothetical protein